MCLFFQSFSALDVLIYVLHTIRRKFCELALLSRCKNVPRRHEKTPFIQLLFHKNKWISNYRLVLFFIFLNLSLVMPRCSYKRGSNEKKNCIERDLFSLFYCTSTVWWLFRAPNYFMFLVQWPAISCHLIFLL